MICAIRPYPPIWKGKPKVSKNGPWAEFRLVTPDEAKYILEHQMFPNRDVRESKAAVYGNMIARGEWLPTGQGLSFNPDEKLIDGQHRLGGIVRADKPALMLIAHNIPDKAQLVMDQGLNRRAHDQIKIQEGWDVQAVHIGICKQMMLSFRPEARYRDLTDILLLNRFYKRHRKAIEFAFGVLLSKGKKERGVFIAPVMAPIARAFYSQDHGRLERFGEILQTGLARAENESAAVLLRNWLKLGTERRLSSRKFGSRNMIYKKSATALWDFVSKRRLTRLSPDLGEDPFPLPQDPKVIKKSG